MQNKWNGLHFSSRYFFEWEIMSRSRERMVQNWVTGLLSESDELIQGLIRIYECSMWKISWIPSRMWKEFSPSKVTNSVGWNIFTFGIFRIYLWKIFLIFHVEVTQQMMKFFSVKELIKNHQCPGEEDFQTLGKIKIKRNDYQNENSYRYNI